MNIWMQPLGPLQTNGYVLSNNQQEGLIIDPGMEPQVMLKHIEQLTIRGILLTHAHFDHIGGLEQVRQQTNAPVYVHDAEQDWLLDPDKNGSVHWSMVTSPIRCQSRDHALYDGQQLQLAGFTFQVLHTPGHSPGSVSFYMPDETIVIAGDTLFYASIGRTDLPGGDQQTLMNSIQKKILTLPEETKVYPGHGPATTIGDERRHNPFITGGS